VPLCAECRELSALSLLLMVTLCRAVCVCPAFYATPCRWTTLHRTGRTARMGARGKGSTAWQIQNLHSVSGPCLLTQALTSPVPLPAAA